VPGPVFVSGDTVDLHTIEREDLEFIQRNVNDPRVRRTLRRVEPQTADDAEEYYEEYVLDEESVNTLACVDGEPVGTATLWGIDGDSGTAGLGCWIAPEHGGEGYATAATRLIVEYAFDQRRLHKVFATTMSTNDPAQRVFEKVGLVREGRHREEVFVDGEFVDWLRYGLLAREFRAD
jgi:RimJ/RimL family protein N-acetyltransferase